MMKYPVVCCVVALVIDTKVLALSPSRGLRARRRFKRLAAPSDARTG